MDSQRARRMHQVIGNGSRKMKAPLPRDTPGGWGDAAMLFARKFRDRALEAKNTWTITKDELDRLEKEMTEDDSD